MIDLCDFHYDITEAETHLRRHDADKRSERCIFTLFDQLFFDNGVIDSGILMVCRPSYRKMSSEGLLFRHL